MIGKADLAFAKLIITATKLVKEILINIITAAALPEMCRNKEIQNPIPVG